MAGRHCCLWCHIKTADLALAPAARGPTVPRTISSLQSDLNSFQRDGSNIKQAKFYNNVIRESFFSIPIDRVRLVTTCALKALYLQVSPPGIFFRLFTLLEDECHGLDVAHSLGLQGSTAGSTFITFTTALQCQCTLRDNIDRLSSQIQALEQLLTMDCHSRSRHAPGDCFYSAAG